MQKQNYKIRPILNRSQEKESESTNLEPKKPKSKVSKMPYKTQINLLKNS